MSKIKFFFITSAIIFLFFSSNVLSQTSELTITQEQLDEIEWKEIRKIKDIYESSVSSGNINNLKKFLSKDFSGVMITGVEVSSFIDLENYNKEIWDLIGKGGEYKVNISYDTGVLVEKHAFAKGITKDFVKTPAGVTYEFESKWSALFSKEDGKWKIYRLHASMDPISNVFVESFLKATKISSFFIGLAGGILIILLGIYILKRRVKP